MEDLIAKLRGLRDDLFSVRGHGWTIIDDAMLALTAQAAEIERLTKERDEARHDFEIAAGDADFLLKSKQEAVTERDALKAEVQKLREALEAEDAAEKAEADFEEYCEQADGEGWSNDPTGSSWISSASMRVGEAKKRATELRHAALQSGGER